MKYSVATEQAIAQLVQSMVRQYSGEGDSPATSESMLAAIERQFRSELQREIAAADKRRQAEDEPTVEVNFEKSTRSLDAAEVSTMDSPASSTHSHPTEAQSAPEDYRILGVLGKGGMGIVYKAWHAPLRRVVAVKMILAGVHASERAMNRFQQEAEAAARLSHPNIVTVYEVGQHDGLPFFSLEYVAGSSMSQMLRDSMLSSHKAAEIMCQVARAIHYSHQQGIVHRDLKPQNIMMTEDGVPKVTDFGLAKLIGDEGQEQTRTGEILGTPGYLAPEQARGERSVGPPADIHALGAILYFLLTGRPPFVGTTPVETVRQVMIEDPLPPSKLQPKLNRELETICLTCMQKEPEKRYASAQDLADELQRVLDGTPILARPITRAERLWKWCKRNPRVATLSGLAATLLLILLCGGYISAGVINRQRLAESEARTEAEANELIAKENEALAEDQADLALDATRVVLYQTQQFFRYKPELTVLRKSMLDGILPEIERIYSVDTRYDVKEKFRASTLKQLGEIYFEAGAYENALERFKESEAIALDLHGQGRLSRSELNLGTLDHLIGDAQLKLGNLDLAEKRYLSMIEHRKRYLAAQPRIQENAKKQSMAEAYGRLGEVYGLQGRVAEAMPLLQQSLDTRRTWYESNPRDLRTGEELAGALGQLSSLYEQSGQHDEMIAASEQALTLLRNSAANKTDFPTVFNLARGLRQLGRQYLVVDRIQEAEECLQESVTNYERALDDTPDYGLAQSQAADAHYLLAQILFRSGREHGQQCRRGIELCGLLLEKSRNTANQVMKLKLVALSGDVEEATRLADEFVGQSNNAFRCLCGAIAYSFSAEHSEEPQRQQLIDKALDLVKIAVVDLKFGDVGVLRNDPDFGPLRRVPEFEQLLSAAESK